MSEHEPFEPELAEIERKLSALSPRVARLNRAATIFRAGQASVHAEPGRAQWVWPVVTAASLLLSVGLTAALFRQPRERIVYVERTTVPTEQPAEQPERSVLPDTRAPVSRDTRPLRSWLGAIWDPRGSGRPNYLRDRQLALQLGVESLPVTVHSSSSSPASSLRYADWRYGMERRRELQTTDESLPESPSGSAGDLPGPLPGNRGGSS